MDLAHFSPIGVVGSATPDARGVTLEVGDERLRIEVVRPDIVRLSLSRAGRFDEQPTRASALVLPGSAAFELEDSPTGLTLATAALRVFVGRPELHLDVYRSDGTPILEGARDTGGRSHGYLVLNDAFALSRRRAATDAIFGLGQRTGRFDRAGRRFLLWNVDVLSPGVLRKNRLDVPNSDLDGASTSFDPYYSTTPFFYHARRALTDGGRPSGYTMAGFFLDNGWPAELDFEDETALRVRFAGGQYAEYVFAGPAMPDVLEGYTLVTGRPHFPPLWSLGHHQCRWHDYTHEELAAVGREYRARGIPCDALWLDIGYMDGYRVFTFDERRFPEPERTFAALREEGFRAVTIVDPGVKLEPGFPVFDAGQAHGHFAKTRAGTIYEGEVWPGRTAFPDFVQDRTRAFWSELVARHAERGVAGIWNDMNEPATGAVEPFGMRFDRDGENDPHERWHNQYALLMAFATREGLARARPGERPFILSRAGFAGIQRVAAQWLGDHASSFEHLAMGLPMALGMGVSGQPFVGGDIPGFTGVASPELAARWFAYAALTPFCRCHHQLGMGEHYPWSFGPEVERLAKEAIALRYRLLPYLYAAFRAATETGEPVQRPLVFDFQSDPNAVAVDDQYLLGQALLVAPVLAAGVTSRRVYLPEGSWLDWHSKTMHEGGRSIEVPAPLEQIPLLVRGGAVIPMLEAAPPTTLGFAPELIELHVFPPSADGRRSSPLYEDDGLSFDFVTGAFLATALELERQGDELVLRGTPSGSGFPEFSRRRLKLVFEGFTPRELRLNGAASSVTNGTLVFENQGEPFEAWMKLEGIS